MCPGQRDEEWAPHNNNHAKKLLHRHSYYKKSTVRVNRFISLREKWWQRVTVEEQKMQIMKNFKLYLENRCIWEENKRLRRKLLLLRQENLALISQFPNKEL